MGGELFMKDFVQNSKDLFLEENYAAAFEAQKDDLLRYFSEDAARQKVSLELENTWGSIQRILKEEIELIFHEGEKRLTLVEFEQLKAEIQSVKNAKNPQSTLDLGSVQWSDTFLDLILKMAKDLVSEKDYKSATSFFHLLTILAPNVCDFWIGLGICLQENHAISEAITIYEVVIEQTKSQHPLPLLFLSECLKQVGSDSEAKDTFQLAQSLIKKNEKFHVYHPVESRVQSIIH